MNHKLEEEDKHKDFIADRSFADNIAYYLRWCSRDIDDDKNKAYVDRCMAQLRKYDKIFILPPSVIPLEDDGFRSSKRYYQYEIHCSIVGILVDNGIDYITMTEPNLEKRISLLKSLYGV